MNDVDYALKGALIGARIVTALKPFVDKRITVAIYGEMVNAVAAALDELHADPMNRTLADEAVREVLRAKFP